MSLNKKYFQNCRNSLNFLREERKSIALLWLLSNITHRMKVSTELRSWIILVSIAVSNRAAIAKMAQLVKSIVNELNQPPFSLNLTNVTFNALHPPQLLQVRIII